MFGDYTRNSVLAADGIAADGIAAAVAAAAVVDVVARVL